EGETKMKQELFKIGKTIAFNAGKYMPKALIGISTGATVRFVAVLLEHTAGKFPLWLTPDQAVILPISEKFNDYANEVAKTLAKADVRVQVDERNEKIGRKIRDNELKRIPFLLIVGEKEAAEGKVSVRVQGEGDKGSMTIAEFAAHINSLVDAEIEANKMQ
ncbi:MAG: threonine--tRNA ligase, partial [Alistipes sp.]|nr:threonine--tRNA ligase [Alistipes sp.]